jgi:hypothetical protein
MSPGPVRRLAGTLGMLALAPTATMLFMGRLSPVDAALRGVATLVAAMVLGRLLAWAVDGMARGFESAIEPEAAGASPATRSPAAPAARLQPTRPGSPGASEAAAATITMDRRSRLDPSAPRRRRSDAASAA